MRAVSQIKTWYSHRQKDMRILIIVTMLLLAGIDVFSQGGVDVKYVQLDSVNETFIGRKVKIDFKSSKGPKKYVVQKARIRDTVQLKLDNRLVWIIEVKGTGVDYWYFEKEYLESFDYNPGLILRIRDIEIKEIQRDSILFHATFEQFKKLKTEFEQVSSASKGMWVAKEKIEGILIKM